MIEGDIRDCFEDIKFDVLYPLIKVHVADNGFEILIRKFFKAGYIVNGHKEVTGGILQGRPLRPILMNIVLHKIDEFIAEEEKKLEVNFRRPKQNPEYTKLIRRVNKSEEKILMDRKEIIKRRLPTRVYNQDNTRLLYVRYVDDFIVGISGTKIFAKEFKSKIFEFLKNELNLNMSIEKTKVTNVVSGRAAFLGAEIHKTPRKKIPYQNGKMVFPRIKISVPVGKLLDKLFSEGIGKKLSNNQ